MVAVESGGDTFFGSRDSADELFRMLTAQQAGFHVVGAADSDRVELDPELRRVLMRVTDAFRRGEAVTVAPRSSTVSTQQAAELLGVSRPTVVKLIDDGHLPCERPGTHRRVSLENVLAYRDARTQHRREALSSLGPTEDGPEESGEAVADRLRRAKAEAGRRRRAASSS